MSGAYPADRFKNLSEDLRCVICQDVPKNPYLAKCQHICCHPCIENWLKQSSSCPVRYCAAPLTPGEYGPPGRIIQNMYTQLVVKCAYADKGCEVQMPFSSIAALEEHVAQCMYAPVKCGNQGCEKMFPRDKLAEHQKTCDHRILYCELCSMGVKWSDINDHKENVCPMVEIECSCGTTIKRRDREQHYLRSCRDRTPVVCPVIGCGINVPHVELDKHLSSSLGVHFRLLGAALQEKDSSVQVLQQEVARLKKRSSDQEATIQQLQRDKSEAAWYGRGMWRSGPEGRCVWTIGNMNQKLKEAQLKHSVTSAAGLQPLPELIWSTQYYTYHNYGYRFSLRIDLGNVPNVGVYIHIHTGEHDDQMPWPFNLDYTITIGSVTSTITQRDSYMHYTHQGRPPHELSWGWANFCNLEAFKEAIQGDQIEVYTMFHSGTIQTQSNQHALHASHYMNTTPPQNVNMGSNQPKMPKAAQQSQSSSPIGNAYSQPGY